MPRSKTSLKNAALRSVLIGALVLLCFFIFSILLINVKLACRQSVDLLREILCLSFSKPHFVKITILYRSDPSTLGTRPAGTGSSPSIRTSSSFRAVPIGQYGIASSIRSTIRKMLSQIPPSRFTRSHRIRCTPWSSSFTISSFMESRNNRLIHFSGPFKYYMTL